MFTPTLLRHHTLRTARSSSLGYFTSHSAASRRLTSSLCLVQSGLRPGLSATPKQAILTGRQSCIAIRNASSRPPARSPYAYPERVNVFQSSTLMTVAIGMARLVSFGLLLYTSTIYAPYIYMDESTSNYWIPVAIITSTTPLIYSLLMGPYVASIAVHLPPSARHSKESIIRFASSTPPSTRVQFRFMRFVPWPITKDLTFSGLRRLPPRWSRLANLEYVPTHMTEDIATSGVYGWLVKAYYGRYWVHIPEGKDLSRVPGAWDRMWEQIPMIDDAKANAKANVAAKQGRERATSGLRNRNLFATGGSPVQQRQQQRPVRAVKTKGA